MLYLERLRKSLPKEVWRFYILYTSFDGAEPVS
jgi:hypothetical protein